jgi:hypothetical protein
MILNVSQAVWGPTVAHSGEMRDFKRSVDGAEISFTCGGWCARCEPLSDPVRLELSTETGNQPS